MIANYRPEIDGLRAVAVLAVIIYHGQNALIPGGYLGVDVFFVISGFLITGIISREIENGSFSILKFYERRARRILPALFFVMLICFPVAAYVMLGSQILDFAKSVVATVLFSSNFLFWSEVDYFAPDAELKPLLHTWSLAVEEQFYIFFPLMLLLLAKLRRQYVVVAIAVTAVFSLGLSEYLSRHDTSTNYYLLPSRAWELLVGALCSYWRRPTELALNNTMSVIGILAILISYRIFDNETPMPSIIGLLPVLGTAAVLLFARHGTFVAHILGFRPFVFVGLISYSAYLWHQPVFAFARLNNTGEFNTSAVGFITILSLGLAALTWYFVEAPLRHKKTGIGENSKRVLWTSIASSTAIGIFAFFIAAAISFKVITFSSDDIDINFKSAGSYVRTAFNARRDKDFSADSKLKIIVVGDSYGQDLTNILIDGFQVDPKQISTHHISKNCGNLFVTENLTPFISIADRADCDRRGRYDSSELLNRISKADLVLLSSAWLGWQVEFLRETVDNIKKITNAKVLLIGGKNFGAIKLNLLANLDKAQKISSINSVNLTRVTTEAAIRSKLNFDYVDFQLIVCGNYSNCPIFTSAGKLISYDGSHLTRDGVIWAAEKLKSSPNSLAEILSGR